MLTREKFPSFNGYVKQNFFGAKGVKGAQTLYKSNTFLFIEAFNMAFQTRVAEPKEAHGISPGDIVRTSENDTLYRYVGIRKGIPHGFEPDLYPETEFLVFDTGIPVYGVGCELPYKFLAVNGQKIQASNVLDVQVDDVEVIGNIEDKLWLALTTFTKWHLDAIEFKHGDYTATLGQLLESYARHQSNKD